MNKNNFNGKNIIITGASRGIGFQITKKFIESGSNVAICSKNLKKLKLAISQLEKIKKKNQVLFYQKVDISNKKNVAYFIFTSIKKLKKVDILINNAGGYGPKGKSEKVSWKKWINTIEVNLFGPILLTRLIIKHFKKNNYGKIIQLSGGGVSGPLPFLNAYGTSKIAVVRYMQSLSEEVKNYNININTIAPGAINTDMLKEILKEGPKKVGKHHYKKAMYQRKIGGTSYKKALDLIFFLSSDESNYMKGKIIHSLWDDWKNFSKHKKIIDNSDIYTLKRVSPKDRGLKWGFVKKNIKFDKQFGPYKKF